MLPKMQSRIEPTVSTGVNRVCPLARGLVGCWLLNEGAGRIVHDFSGYHRDGSFSGSPAWFTGLFGRSIEFDGNDDWISMGDCLDLGTDDISLLAIVRYNVANQPDEWSGNRIGAIAGKGYLESMGKGYGLTIGTANQVHWQIRNQTVSFSAISDAALNDGQWHVAIGVCDRDDSMGVRLYIDGVLQSITADATTLNGVPLNGSRAFAIGSRQDETTGSWFWDFAGSIAMVCVWKRVLADWEILNVQQDPYAMIVPRRSIAMFALPVSAIIQCTGFTQAVTSTSAVVRVTRGAAGTVIASGFASAILSTVGFISLSGTASGCSALHGDLCILDSQTAFSAMVRTETPWLREALFNGATHSAFKLGTVLTQGWFWTRRNGCTAAHRGATVNQVDLSRVLYVAEPETKEMPLPAYLSHAAGSTHCYLLQRFDSCGHSEKTMAAVAVVHITLNGELAQAQPNAVIGPKSEQTSTTGVQLVWFYCPLDQKIAPAHFDLYQSDLAGEIDLKNPTEIVRYEGRRFYCWRGTGLASEQQMFVLQAVSRAGTEGMSRVKAIHRIAVSPPEPAAILVAKST